MNEQVKNDVSAADIQTVQATLIIPLAITGICSAFDMLFHIKLGMIELDGVNEWICWILGTLISYFFPSFLASASTLFWQYYFTDSWVGIKEGKGLLLGIITLLYFLYNIFVVCRYKFYICICNIKYIICMVCFEKMYGWENFEKSFWNTER